ncbi:MAG: CPBP family intramembrane metalloprotease, partial [Planctomycetota bacterium]|nr:CPBP family intramembrane metalloprotease [Planctomycetota bacterium]
KSKLLGSALSKLLVTLFLIGLVAVVAMSKSPGTKIDLSLQGLNFKGAWGEVARGARLYFAFLPVIVAIVGGTSVLAGWLGLNQVPHPIQTFLADFDSTALILAFLVAVIGAPIQEEIIFRGLLLPALGKLAPLPIAMVISAWFFGSMHLGFHSVLPITGLGVFFAYLTVTAPKRSIVASITAHMIHNSLSLGLFLAVHHVTST